MPGKISDGKSVIATVPAGGVENGKFYFLEGILGCAFATRAEGETVALNIEMAEYETKQILTSETFAKGTKIYWDVANTRFTEVAAGNIFAGVVTVAKDSGNVIWFVLAPQGLADSISTTEIVDKAVTESKLADAVTTKLNREAANQAVAAGAAPTKEEFDGLIAKLIAAGLMAAAE